MYRILLVIALVSACSNVPILVDPTPENAGTVQDCAAACARLEELQCPGYQGADDGTTCTKVCEDIVSDPAVTLFQRCTVESKTCEQIEDCFAQ